MNSINFNNKPIIPSKIICIGRNYVEHIKELGNETPDQMVIFNKPNSAISNTLHYFGQDTRFEGEICLLIKNNKIDGIGFGLDLTDAKIQNKMKENSWPWERAKCFDGSCVLSDFIKFHGDIKNIRFEMKINGVLTQYADYDLMIYKPQDILEEISSFMSFEDGDIIMTGTPKGVSNYQKNDIFDAKIFEGENLILEVSWKVN
jgi:2-keto-4-pentenoate hydratase/2-oxohepta-3-ene-1,7-dioic acid hydratase in catechol pathway